jgi:hypothetical protein
MKKVLRLLFRGNQLQLIFLLLVITIKTNSQSVDRKEIPHVIAFQGILSEKNSGSIPNDFYDICFALYDVKEGGTPIWIENYNRVKIENGILNVLLGRNNKSNPISFTFDKKLFLDIKINGDIGINQRIELGGTAYSLGSVYAEEVNDSSITTQKFADESVTDEKIESVSWNKLGDVDPDPYSIYWTILGNIIFGPERNYVGTIEEKDFVLKTFSIERMRFGANGRVTIGTEKDTVEFTVIGKSKFQDVFIKGNLGIGVMPGAAKVHINSQDIIPFKVDVDDVTRFQINTNGKVEINSSIGSGNKTNRNSYPLFINGKMQGMGIKVKGSSDNDNNFVSFWDDDGMAGRIEGESYLNYLADPTNIMRELYIIATGVADIMALGLAAEIEPASAIAFSAEVLYNTIMIALENANLGVTYESASGDYAEWLEKKDAKEFIEAGDIIGLYNGKISKYTTDADQLSCISHSPIVLGNQPESEVINRYEKVAFIGQVPIKVIGKVMKGDYIIPSGLNDGVGIAVSPDMMTIDEYLIVVGRAWTDSESENIKLINTSIGFDNREMIKILQLESERHQRLQKLFESTNAKIKNANSRISEIYSEVKKLNTQYQNANKKSDNNIEDEKK